MREMERNYFAFVPSKVFGRVLIDIIRDEVNSKLRDDQAGFSGGKVGDVQLNIYLFCEIL